MLWICTKRMPSRSGDILEMEIKKFFDLIYCINLDEREDRWEKSLEEFKKLNLNVERFSAISRPDNPVLGCFLSHIELIKEAASENKNILIFEDDVEFTCVSNKKEQKEFKLEYIEKALDELSKLPRWDMFFLGGNPMTYFYQISPHLAKLTRSYSSQAYGVNRHYAKGILPILENHMDVPIDVVYSDMLMPLGNMFITVPMVAIQKAGYSNLYKTNVDFKIPVERYKNYLVNISF